MPRVSRVLLLAKKLRDENRTIVAIARQLGVDVATVEKWEAAEYAGKATCLTHREVSDALGLWSAGTPVRSIAARYGVTPHAIHILVRNCATPRERAMRVGMKEAA